MREYGVRSETMHALEGHFKAAQSSSEAKRMHKYALFCSCALFARHIPSFPCPAQPSPLPCSRLLISSSHAFFYCPLSSIEHRAQTRWDSGSFWSEPQENKTVDSQVDNASMPSVGGCARSFVVVSMIAEYVIDKRKRLRVIMSVSFQAETPISSLSAALF